MSGSGTKRKNPPPAEVQQTAKQSKKKRRKTKAANQPLSDFERKIIAEAAKQRSTCSFEANQTVLLLGCGDFSFPCALARMGMVRLVATSLESRAEVQEKYLLAQSHIAALERMGCQVLHRVDCTRLNEFPSIKGRQFDRVVFNYPHTGVNNFKAGSVEANQTLLRGVFASAQRFVKPGSGELHVTLKTEPIYNSWRIAEQCLAVAQASDSSLSGLSKKKRKQAGLPLVLKDRVDFDESCFFGYRHKQTLHDRSVDCPGSKTYVFGPRSDQWQTPEHALTSAGPEWTKGTFVCDGETFASKKALENYTNSKRHKERSANDA